MKYPVYWFLISSGLIASTSLSFAQGESQTLTPADSYNGNGTFTPKTSSNSTSTTYTCEGNVCIANAGNPTPLTGSCFSQTAGNLIFIGNGHSLCFDSINAGSNNPGAINVSGNDKTLSVTGFSSFSCASCPPGTTGMGAIKAVGNTTIKDNTSLIFNRNCSSTNGGAISCTSTSNNADLKFEGNQHLVFFGNLSKSSGGAIYTDKLTITSGGLTLFSNNTVSKASDPKGGAICLNNTSSECSLTADLGNIIFDGNKIITTGGNAKTVRNSIDLGTGGKFTQLRAKDGFGIFFYDPIANNGDTNTEIEINKAEGTTTYSGQIVFSGEKLTVEEKTEAENLQSYFKQPLKIDAGSLVLKDSVTVTAKKITQTQGSSVVMDLGTTLQTPSADGDVITLTDLAINVTSLGGGGVPRLLKLQQQQLIKTYQSLLLI
ncbi:chemotaxis protein [Chlamydia crocodili]|uniref:chemotaxis protein n=1 Tax=Chlamydia TaxID=810 RepID=UPI002FCA191C